jgi:pSer/pThr/pTyr-binding forkhead associated (FHA) protein/tetratricopeptide (TPR) repeat protein
MLILTISRAGEHFAEIKASGDQPVTLGSSNTNTLTLPDDSLASEHAALSLADGQWVLTDLSGRGLSVNSLPVTQGPIQDGDIISLGLFKIVAAVQTDQARQVQEAAGPPASEPEPGPAADQAPDKTVFRMRPTFEGQGQNALEVFAGPRLGLILRFGDALRIGRGEKCDLVLQDPSISREHGLLTRTHKGFEAKSLSERNPMTVNGQSIRTAPVKTGDVLGVGPARLRLALGAGATPSGRRLTIPAGLKNRKVLLAFGGGLFLALVLAMFLSGPKNRPGEAVLQEARQKEQAAGQAELAGRVSALLVQGQKLADQGDLDQALARYQAALDIKPGQDEAERAVADLRAKMVERDATARERERRTAELRGKVVGLIMEGDRLLAQGKFEEAEAQAGKALAVSPDDQEARDLLAKARQAGDTARRQAEEKSRQQAESRAILRETYAKADEKARAGQLYPAMKLYRDGAAQDADQTRAAEAKVKAASLQDALVKQIMPDYNQGLKFYAQKKYREALKSWLKALEVYPEARETTAKVAEIKPIMEAEAKRLYEEGLVYEGLGNRQEAMNRWQAVLEAMPFEDNPYRQKALAKQGR